MKIEKKYYDSGHLYKETYFLDNIVHRDDGPAEICYYPSGKIASEEYYVNGKRHRINGPAYITYEEYGDIISEQHWINDMAHRLIHMWYVNGKLLGRFNIHKKPKQESLSQYIFSYLNQHPEYINEIYILARHNNWLTNDQLALLNCMDIFT